eukprot:CAMPEP_0181216378 /NCGR_PEP_ID=MMETSP1096-20121128/26552_1 /TAXON_ID=156174 ORGANISM="Chrysochromulina ericina, Strain CCMP281" /NCGR_SAMPLE_ID=MMETSP1096 /ASSEMBLY_ACC=CAM_ASM_000453 /LENGTH=217 /DNA_ID=CAMNT_0023308371 /DNA_START=561 /DNA_END=1215 /DNA_ORIENTATION=+
MVDVCGQRLETSSALSTLMPRQSIGGIRRVWAALEHIVIKEARARERALSTVAVLLGVDHSEQTAAAFGAARQSTVHLPIDTTIHELLFDASLELLVQSEQLLQLRHGQLEYLASTAARSATSSSASCFSFLLFPVWIPLSLILASISFTFIFFVSMFAKLSRSSDERFFPPPPLTSQPAAVPARANYNGICSSMGGARSELLGPSFGLQASVRQGH